MNRIAWLAVLAGCSTKPHDVVTLVDASIDSPPPDVMQVGPNAVEIQLLGTDPDLFVYRDGTGGWLAPDNLGNGRYRLHVTSTYEVVAVCSFDTGVAGNFDAEEVAATVDDGKQYVYCGGGGGGTAVTPVAVSGTMNQPGTIALGDTASSTTAPWTFNLQVYPGHHDLSAIGNHRMLLQRGLSISAALALPTVDVVNDGLAMGSATLALGGKVAGEVVSSEFDLYTTNEYITVSRTTDDTVELPPAALLDAQDFTYLSIDSRDAANTVYRAVYAYDYDGSTTAFTLPSALTGITFATTNDTLNASWAQLPASTSIDLFVFAGGATFFQQHVTATKSWLDATGATSIAFDTSAPDYAAAWKPDLSAQHVRVFGIDDREQTLEYQSEIAEIANGATVRRAPHVPTTALKRKLRRR